jgi:hypothetical protein
VESVRSAPDSVAAVAVGVRKDDHHWDALWHPAADHV